MNTHTRYLSPDSDPGQPRPNDLRNVPEDGPSGENTVNDGERGGGLWTSGGHVSTGTPYHDDYGTPGPNRKAEPEDGN